MTPYEMHLDAPVKHFVCGPQSTLVLTQSDNLYLTGCLNDFIFTNFTKLQQNLSPTEHIVFMHISITNEIYIVTNAANIYRSKEITSNKMLMFQRFHDYDSLENGPIWKLLRGFSFYTALAKSHRFFTTFSESGHHLKTFREISKFKNLRLLDMAVGEQHVLVFGVLKSAMLPTTFGPDKQHSYMSQAYVLDSSSRHSTGAVANAMSASTIAASAATTATAAASLRHNDKSKLPREHEVENEIVEEKEVLSANKIPANDNELKNEGETATDDIKEQQSKAQQKKLLVKEQAVENQETPMDLENDNFIEERVTKDEVTGETEAGAEAEVERTLISNDSHKSVHVKLAQEPEKEERVTSSSKRLVRQHTPYPGGSSSTNSTPSTIIRTPLRNLSYETAVHENENNNTVIMSIINDIENDEQIEKTSLKLVESLEDIRQELENDKFMAETITKISTIESPDGEEQLIVETITEAHKNHDAVDADDDANDNEIRFINDGIDVTGQTVSEHNGLKQRLEARVRQEVENISENVENTLDNVKDKTMGVVNVASSKVKLYKENLEEKLTELPEKVENIANDTADNLLSNAKQGIQKIGQKLTNEVQSAKDNIGGLLMGKSLNKKDNDDDNDNDDVDNNNDVDDDEQLSTLEVKKSNFLMSEDDERTTASINSNHNSSGNPFENGLNNNSNALIFDDNAIVERGKRALQEELERTMSSIHPAGGKSTNTADKSTENTGMMRQLFNEIRDKSKSISCRSEKSIPVAGKLSFKLKHKITTR